jgi:hypothetical protein
VTCNKWPDFLASRVAGAMPEAVPFRVIVSVQSEARPLRRFILQLSFEANRYDDGKDSARSPESRRASRQARWKKMFWQAKPLHKRAPLPYAYTHFSNGITP